MAGAGRQDSHPLIRQLLRAPWGRDFFLALREIERAFPDYPRIGRSLQLSEDPIRFGQFYTLAHSSDSLYPSQNTARPPKLAVAFTGLTGPDGPMPIRYTEFIRNRLLGIKDPDALTESERNRLRGNHLTGSGDDSVAPKDSTLADFLDIFHHRMISLFYRAWAAAQKTVDFDREEDRCFAEWLASLCGLGLPDLDGMDSVPTWEKLPFTGHLAAQTRHTSGLESILSKVFSAPAEILCLTGHWIQLPELERCRLGESPRTGCVGSSCIVGSKIWDKAMKFTVLLGPLTFSQYESLLPDGECHQRLHDWINFYTRRQFWWRVTLILRKEEVPKIVLGKSGRLGFTTWLATGGFEEDPRDYHISGGNLDPPASF